jgi:opacity protein-like surface antigen
MAAPTKPATKTNREVAAVSRNTSTEQVNVSTVKHALTVGAQLGPSVYGVSGDEGLNSSQDLGISLGVNVEVKLPEVSRYVYLQPELNFTQKNATALVGAGAADVTMNYLELPILLKVKTVSEVSGVRPYAFLGPNFGLRLDGDVETTNGNTTTTVSLDDRLERFEVALDFGLGAEAKITEKVAAYSGVRASIGLTDLAKGEGDLKTYGMQFVFGARYSI